MAMRKLAVFLAAALVAGCSSSADPSTTTSEPVALTGAPKPGNDERTELTHEALTSGAFPSTPVDERHLARPPSALEPSAVFEGRLRLDTTRPPHLEVIRGDSEVDPDTASLPGFDFLFVQAGNEIVPTERGLVITDHPVWNYHLEPGDVWSEEGDRGMTRASIPFALIPKGGSSTYNGTMMFLFDESTVSDVWFQITQETSFFFRANFWGGLGATYEPEPVSDAEEVRSGRELELTSRMPVKPLSSLADDYPGTDPSQFGRGLTPEHRTTYGVVVDGVNYRAECTTRFGLYAHCEEMRFPSWSTAKSAFAATALMRLSQAIGPEVGDALVKDYVPEVTAAPGDWEHVTIEHALDMATGNFESAHFMVDEEQFSTHPFWTGSTYSEKMAGALAWPAGGEPGETWVYFTGNTFIATTAMANWLSSEAGADIDLFDYVVEEVYRPLGLGPGVESTVRTSDNNWSGAPVGGYGMWWIADDLAKISTMLQSDGVAPDGSQLFDPSMVRASLFRDSNDVGLPIDDRNAYNNSFWATSYGRGDGYDCEFWVAQMQGISGVVVVLMPNGVTYYYASDNQEFTWDAAVRAADGIATHCGTD